MEPVHIAVWIDHREAHLLRVGDERFQVEIVHAHGAHHTHRPEHHPLDTAFFEAVARALPAGAEILLCGPAQAKGEFKKHLEQHHTALARSIVGVETLDHPTDGALAGLARRYFHAVDRMRGNTPGS